MIYLFELRAKFLTVTVGAAYATYNMGKARKGGRSFELKLIKKERG